MRPLYGGVDRPVSRGRALNEDSSSPHQAGGDEKFEVVPHGVVCPVRSHAVHAPAWPCRCLAVSAAVCAAAGQVDRHWACAGWHRGGCGVPDEREAAASAWALVAGLLCQVRRQAHGAQEQGLCTAWTGGTLVYGASVACAGAVGGRAWVASQRGGG